MEEESEEGTRKSLIWGNSLLGSVEAGNYHYYHKNEHGDIELLTEETGRITNRYQYEAFGGFVQAKEEERNRFRYSGEVEDELTGQYYLRARYYCPKLGRFTQEDSYRGDGLNLYAYCRNNPVFYIDPSGYASKNITPNTGCPKEEDESKKKISDELEGNGSSNTINIKKISVWNKIKNIFINKKNIEIDKIYYNPKDDVFTRRSDRFNDNSLAFHKKYIAENGDIYRNKNDIFTVYDLGDGTYMLQNGHYRFRAAQIMKLKSIKVEKIIPYNITEKLGILNLERGKIPKDY